MARILAYTSPARGHLYPLTPILDELRFRGHEIALRTLSCQVELMRSHGFDAQPIDGRIEQRRHDDWRARTPQGALKRAVRGFSERAEFDAADLRRALADERPDATIVDVNCWGALAAAEAWGGAWASFCPYPMALSSRDAPPFGPGLRPARGRLGRLRDRALRPLLMGGLERAFLPPINGLRRELALPPFSSADQIFAGPPLVLYLTAEPFEYPRSDWPENVVLVGPCPWEPPAEPPTWLEHIDRPIVLVTTSSEFQNDAKLVTCALQALAGEDLHLVATLPAQDPAGLEIPDNAHVVRFAAHRPLLQRAVCAITHGGMGATQKALAAGVPVCTVPFGRDQLEVARRVEVCGAGARLPASRLNPHRLRSKVLEAIARKPEAQNIASAFAAAGGPAAAAGSIEHRLLRRPISNTPAAA